ncbi:hypothetical protein JZO70_21525 [Enterococcus sp. 669A]|uniref:DUF4136 domain-containing protein n=1 Tax=Candidatus Enterococcus moelleringii TaxID=2815325 RepID=A0ABS3LGJ3_9ENTE|nr:hypothetical protein [Enterococcus sp. 669A]MBO1308767.1 hypothetical protein [Enterococcus sp. 669A]
MKKIRVVIVLLVTVILSGCSRDKEFSNEEIEKLYFEQRVFNSANSLNYLLPTEELNEITKDYLGKTFNEPELSEFETSFYSEYFGSEDTVFSIRIESYGYLYEGPGDAEKLYNERKNDSYYDEKVFSLFSDIGEGVLVSTKGNSDPSTYWINIEGIMFTDQSQLITFHLGSSDEPYMEVEVAEELARKIANKINQNYQNMRA